MSSSVETNGGDVEKGVGNPNVANDKTQEVVPVVADGGRKKKFNFVKFKFTNLQTCFDIVKLLLFLLTLIALVVLAFQVSRDQNTIQKLNHELGDVSHMRVENTTAHELRAAGDISYMDGFSGMIEEKDNVDLVGRAVMVTGASSTVSSFVNATSTMDTCDDETDVPDATTTGPFTTTTVQAFLNTTVAGPTNTSSSAASVTFIASVDALSVSLTSVTLTSSTTQTTTVSSGSSTQTCGEWGDGAGPCDRPYGSPNTPPPSTSSTSPAMTMAMPATSFSATTSVDAISASTPVVDSITTTSSSNSNTTETVDLSMICAPTATVYVTITASAVEDAPGMTAESANNSSAPLTTTTTTSTSLVTTLTMTIPGTNGPEVLTETLTGSSGAAANNNTFSTVAWVNATGVTNANLTTASFTVTLTAAHAGNATHMGAGAGASSTPTAGASTVPLMSSGGDKAVGKPMGANGSASGTGNGVYCVVMLVSLVALLI